MRITQEELARDVRMVMERVQRGGEIIVEGDNHQSLAVIHAFKRSGRPITEILEEAKRLNSTVTLDSDFGNDMEEIIESHRQPWNPPSWD